MRPKPERIFVAQPPAGGKVYLIERPGLFVLEVGPGTLITDACTHAGAGSMVIQDGVPDERGYFPDAPVQPSDATCYAAPDDWDRAQAEWREAYAKRHGRDLLRFSPAVMGSWMLNGGFHNGLTVEVAGGHQGMAPVASIVWMPYKGVRTA